jgi:FAD:protein FMN transferase
MEIFRFGFKAMGCGCEVVAAGYGRGAVLTAAEAAMQEVTRIERKYSRYREESVVSTINGEAGMGAVECDEETMLLLRHADSLHRESGGKFDLTSGVLRKAWDFTRPVLPARHVIERLLQLVGWEEVELREASIRLPRKGMEIDLGGIGKEYASDRAAEVLYEKGIRHGYVNMAGDIRVVGLKPDGAPWTIGVRDPRVAGKTLASIPLFSGALATSGDYERFIEVGGRRYCHLLDPRTGFPVDFWRSVTVIASTALDAGSRTTVAMLKGSEGLDYLKSSGLSYLAIDSAGRMYHKD